MTLDFMVLFSANDDLRPQLTNGQGKQFWEGGILYIS
jgi:hypothetical protein